MGHNLWVEIGIGALVLAVLLYWWLRPVHWTDGEGQISPSNPFDDTDVGSFRWWYFNHTEEGRVLRTGLNLRDWWENERRRWRR
jgi:hypothetical protein